jgi:hypothetical protein
MYFSPAYISSLITDPLRYLFSRYAPNDLIWDEDPLKSLIEIDTINNYNKEAIQTKPRVLVSRGGYMISSSGLSNNMVEGTDSRAGGPKIERKALYVSGNAQILIEAVNEGTCEKITELVENFLTWSSPIICNVQGFKQFGLPLSVSPCTPGKEDKEIFQCSLGVPWMKENHFKVIEDGLELKQFVTTIGNING